MKSKGTICPLITPKIIRDFNNPAEDVAGFFDYHRELFDGAEEVIVVFGVGNSDQMLEYRGKDFWDDNVNWARYIWDDSVQPYERYIFSEQSDPEHRSDEEGGMLCYRTGHGPLCHQREQRLHYHRGSSPNPRHYVELLGGPGHRRGELYGIQKGGSEKFELMENRIGDLFVLGDKDVVFGEFDTVEVPVKVRSHGSRHESAVPIIAYGNKMTGDYQKNLDLVCRMEL